MDAVQNTKEADVTHVHNAREASMMRAADSVAGPEQYRRASHRIMDEMGGF